MSEQFKGFKQPNAILLNAGSYSFCKTRLDETSMNFLCDNYHKITNVVDRFVFISILINMVKDAKYSAMKFMKLFVDTLVHEQVALIREKSLLDVILFLGYLKPEDTEKVSIKLWNVFID